jgi:hypothetical protein
MVACRVHLVGRQFYRQPAWDGAEKAKLIEPPMNTAKHGLKSNMLIRLQRRSSAARNTSSDFFGISY